MRKILMNEKGEFERQIGIAYTDYIRASAVKMMATLLQRTRRDAPLSDEDVVIFSNNSKQLNR